MGGHRHEVGGCHAGVQCIISQFMSWVRGAGCKLRDLDKERPPAYAWIERLRRLPSTFAGLRAPGPGGAARGPAHDASARAARLHPPQVGGCSPCGFGAGPGAANLPTS